MLTQKNYYTNREYISYHDILDFLKCEYLFHKKREGEVKRIERDYFVYGNAFDSMLTGDFQREFAVGKNVNVEERKEKLRKDKLKYTELIEKYKGKDNEKSKAIVAGNTQKLAEAIEEEKALADIEGKTIVSDSIFKHIESSVAEFARQPIIEKFERDAKRSQVILTGKYNGMKIKGKLDWFDENIGIVDYKTTASMVRFDPYQYAGQLAWYQNLARLKFKKTLPCYIFVVDKDTESKHSGFWKYKQGTLDAKMEEFPKILEDMKMAMELKMYTPRAHTRIEECWTCDHYNECPFTVQDNFYEI